MDTHHAMVIGGTGMLCRATAVIAENAQKVTVVAKTRTSLTALANLVPYRECGRYETLDWNTPDQFVRELQQLVKEVGHPGLVLAWLHDMNLAPHVAAVISTPETPCDFFQVIGSSGGSPHGGATALRQQVEAVTHLRYFQVVLGFKRDAGASRWLTNDEISNGVLEAIRKREACHIVGLVTPWDQRP